MQYPVQARVWIAFRADMASTFEFVSHFVRCGTVTVSPNRMIILIVYINIHCHILSNQIHKHKIHTIACFKL